MPTRHARRTVLAPVPTAAAVALVTLIVTGALATAAGAEEPVSYRPPVEAPVSDPFRPPATRYGPGNRGLAYDLQPGTSIHATADGTVVYAGFVAGTQHVTVLHADGLRSSYSFLSGVAVQRGAAITQGDVVGVAGPGFHLGVRDGEAYLDPAALFDPHSVHVRLVPHSEPLPPTDAGLLREQASLRDVVRTESPGLLHKVVRGVAARGSALARSWLAGADAAWTTWHQLSPVVVALDVAESFARHARQDCTPSSVTASTPPGERVALLVAGLGSTSEHGSIDDVDVRALGYDDGDVLRYSYAGGRVPRAGLHPALAAIDAADYAAGHTLGDVRQRGRELADLIQQAALARPGAPIDVYAHSLGGLVTRVALLELATRPGGIEVLGQVVTIGSPHSGADLATLAAASGPRLGAVVRGGRDLLGIEIDPYSPAVGQLGETSDLVDLLREAGVPDGVDLRTVAARGDLVVTADKADVPGHPSAIIDRAGLDAHAALPGDPDTTRELQLGLAGLPPACQGLFDAAADAAFPEVVSALTGGATLAALIPG